MQVVHMRTLGRGAVIIMYLRIRRGKLHPAQTSIEFLVPRAPNISDEANFAGWADLFARSYPHSDSMALSEDSPTPDAIHRQPATRVDAAHPPLASNHATALLPVDAPQPAPRETVMAATGRSPVHAQVQLQMQAAQLGDQLKRRQEELDRREAQMNAETAELENELRQARLWLRERTEELDRREAEMQAQADSLQEQATRTATLAEAHEKESRGRELVLAEREAALHRKGASLRNWEAHLYRETESLREQQQQLAHEREQGETALLRDRQRWQTEQQALQQMLALAAANLEKHRAAVEEQEARLNARLGKSFEIDRLDEAHQTLEFRRLRLHEAEQLLSEQREELDDQRRQLAEERAELARRIAEQNAAWEARSTEAGELWRRRREALSRRAEQLDHRRTAVEALYAEAMNAHRETLEMRLAIEQMWLELQGAHAPAAITQSLAEARRKLAEHAQHSTASFAEQREELHSLADRLTAQQVKLRQQREELDREAAARHREIEQQAAWLAAREQELNRQERDFREAERRWADEKRDLQRRLREALSDSLRPIAA
jgi:hypothetical protein